MIFDESFIAMHHHSQKCIALYWNPR